MTAAMTGRSLPFRPAPNNRLAYHDYMLMMASLDAEWTRNPGHGMEAIQQSFHSFDETCARYRQSVERNCRGWKKAGGRPRKDGDLKMDEYLFLPRHWVPCGHSDAMCLALIDDLDAAQTVIETYPKTVEEVAVAFCPKISGYLNARTRKIFVEPHDLFKKKPGAGQQPLMQFARLKLQGIVTLGRAMVTLETSYRLIINQIDDALTQLRQHLEAGGGVQGGTSILSRADLDALQVCVLDLQEEEEIGLLFFTTNLSLPMTVLSHIQALKIDDLLKLDPEVGRHLAQTSHYQEIQAFADRMQVRGLEASLLDNIRDSHLLRWTRSTAAFSSDLFPAPAPAVEPEPGPATPAERNAAAASKKAQGVAEAQRQKRRAEALMKRVNGWITPWIMINHAPGHQWELENVLLELMKQVRQDAKRDGQPPAADYRLHVVGSTDYILQIAETLNNQEAVALHAGHNVVSTCTLIQAYVTAPEVLARYARRKDPATGKARTATGRHLSGWSTTVGVPVPVLTIQGREDFFHPPVSSHHRAIIKELLDKLRERIFPVAKNRDPDAPALRSLSRAHTGQGSWRFCVDALRLSTRVKGLPVETRRSLIVMYENFASIISNPLLFDIVLDLYDVMATLYQILVTLPKNWQKPDIRRHPRDYTPRADPHFVDRLNDIIAAIDSALELRQRRLYPEIRMRDWALDFRSNILQIILSAEAAMKCGVGIYRKFIRGHEHVTSDLGVIHQVAFASSISVPEASLATAKDHHLACFRSGVAHLTHLTGFAEFFHEAFHLVFDHRLRGVIAGDIKFNDTIEWSRNDEDDEATATAQAGAGTVRRPAAASSRLVLQDEHKLLSHIAWRVATSESPSDMRDYIVRCHSEVFVHLMMMMFIHDGDWQLALRNHAMGYSTNPRNVGPNRKQARTIFVVQFAPILIATMLVRVAQAAARKNGGEWWQCELDKKDWPTLEDARAHLHAELQDLMPWLADADWLFYMQDAERHPRYLNKTLDQVLSIYLDMHDHLFPLWDQAQEVYSNFVKYVTLESLGKKPGTPASLPPPTAAEVERFRCMSKALDEQIARTLGHASTPRYEPVVGALATQEMWEAGLSMDAALVASRCLKAHIRSSIGKADRPGQKRPMCRALRRSVEEKGHIDWKGIKDPTILMMDRTATALFCCVPGERRRRTGWRIALYKTFWDIASRNRARRLRSLFRQATPGSAGKGAASGA